MSTAAAALSSAFLWFISICVTAVCVGPRGHRHRQRGHRPDSHRRLFRRSADLGRIQRRSAGSGRPRRWGSPSAACPWAAGCLGRGGIQPRNCLRRRRCQRLCGPGRAAVGQYAAGALRSAPPSLSDGTHIPLPPVWLSPWSSFTATPRGPVPDDPRPAPRGP